jgi:DNA-binding response OmpR family regulator
LRVEPTTRRTTYYGQDVHLSDSEFRVCNLLVERAGRLVGYGELVEAIWGSDDALGGTEMLKTAVWRLRTRLSQIDPAGIIENIRGQGYRMRRLMGQPPESHSDGSSHPRR